MKISICIATWHRKSKLEDLIEILEHQSIRRDLYEIIVVDSNSPYGTDILMDGYCRKYSNIKYIRDSKNILAAKRNIGIVNASNEIIIIMDDDVSPSYDFVFTHYNANKNNKNTFYCGQIRFPHELCEKSNYYKFRDHQHLSSMDMNKTLAFNKIVAMNMSFKKEFIEQIGGFNERFVGYGCEDIEFGYRIIQNGYKLEYLEGAFAIHLNECANIQSYGKKLYKTGLYGHRVLMNVCPEILDILYNKSLLTEYFLSSRTINHILELFLQLTDYYPRMYNFLIYKAYLYSCMFIGRRDQDKYPELGHNDIINGW